MSNSHSVGGSSSSSSSSSNTYKCPHCEHIYSSTLLTGSSSSEQIDKCEHLLCHTLIVSKLNTPYQAIHDFTSNLMGVKVPVVIVNRFIRFLRDKNASNPQGYYTIQQSRARISNTFQGVTAFTLNAINNETQCSVQYSYYLTANPLSDIAYFESFILKNYIDIFALMTSPVSIDISSMNEDNKQQQQPTTCINQTSTSASSTTTTTNSLEDNNSIYNKEIVYVNISDQQMQGLLKQNIEDDEDIDGRWIIVTGIPNQIPTFIWISPMMQNADKIMLPIRLLSQHTFSSLSSLSIKISPLIKLPSVAIQI
ncbi:hypothetical protein PPL_08634 [Heterostelium album PN500]|uniref:Uncharacterized protein n=1 Tax=Heterostelium pallidum (strain ATCC 26659 / Pp 5 / PN500) TaxID=670386 RepID=D3BJA9_HETP5|nr:hypothetical protein PPL_08634 [Heterostelium album PN500]EFA77989.1 hypothetical protein PPL_08634 [Heterostelium album PN500]|eukprot:XP_020430117.1 hypothetical protein PPL_08634 [Heterostelium album PN500]